MDNRRNLPKDNSVGSEPMTSRDGWDSTGTVNLRLKDFYERCAVKWVSFRELKTDLDLPIPDYFPPCYKWTLLCRRFMIFKMMIVTHNMNQSSMVCNRANASSTTNCGATSTFLACLVSRSSMRI